MSTSFPHAVTFSIVSHSGVDHEFIMGRYAETIENMQKPDVYVSPAKIEAILQLLATYTAEIDKKAEQQPLTSRLSQKFSQLRGTRDVDIHKRSLEKLLTESELQMEQAIRAFVINNPELKEVDCLALGAKLTEISTRLKMTKTAGQAYSLFAQSFGPYVAACNPAMLESWTDILLQTHSRLQWIKPVIDANPSDEKLKALTACLRTYAKEEHPEKRDLMLFVHLHDASQSATAFKTAYTLFLMLQTPKERSFDEAHITCPQIATLLATFLKKYIPCGDREYIRRALALITQQQETAWLDQLLDKDAPEDLMDHIEELFQADTIRTSDAVFTVYNRYKKISEGSPSLSKIDQLRIALWVETKIHNRFETRVFQKIDTGLACHIQYDIGGDLFLLFGKKKSSFNKEGTFKRYTAALLLPRAECDQARIVSHGMNHTLQQTAEFDTYYSDSEDLASFRREANIHQRFSGKKGIWPMLSFCEFEKTKKTASGEVIVPRISMITDYAPHDLTEWKKFEFSDYQFFLLCDALIHGLDAFHSQGWLIGDIKQENILFKMLSKIKLAAGFTDFGSSFSKDDPSHFRSLMQQGWYGCEKFTAPELFGTQDFKGDLLKAEIWALGCVLYEIYIDTLPWPLYIKHMHDEGNSIAVDDSAHVKKLIERQIENSAGLLSSRKNRSPREDLTLWIYQLLRLDPTARPSTQEAIKTLKSLEGRL